MDEGLLVFLVLLTLLLAMFLDAVVTTPPQQAVAAGRPALESPPLPVGLLPASALPAGAASRPGEAVYAARHTPAAAPAISPPKVSSPPRPAGLAQAGLAAAGTVLTVLGGWLLIGTGKAARPCSHQGGALCSQGLVMLTGTQLLGGPSSWSASPSSSPRSPGPCASWRRSPGLWIVPRPHQRGRPETLAATSAV
jgi:hypothetical protein